MRISSRQCYKERLCVKNTMSKTSDHIDTTIAIFDSNIAVFFLIASERQQNSLKIAQLFIKQGLGEQ